MVSIVIPVFNRVDYTVACIESLKATTHLDFRVILVDDGSTDKTQEIISTRFPEVIIISGDGSWWWTKSTNMGIKKAIELGSDYIMMLNNDTIAQPDFVHNMIKPIEQNQKTVVGALGIDKNSNLAVQRGLQINWLLAKNVHHKKIDGVQDVSGLKSVSCLPGRGMSFHASLIREIGYPDEKHLPQYTADFDFSIRAAENGYNVYCNYDAKLLIYPEESGSKLNRKQKTLKKFKHHLFGIKGDGNLMNFFRFGVRHCPAQYLVFYLPIGMMRRVVGFWLK